MIRVYRVDGMSCANCKRLLKSALMSIHGIKDISVSISLGEITVDADFDTVSDDEIIGTIDGNMFTAQRRYTSKDKRPEV